MKTNSVFFTMELAGMTVSVTSPTPRTKMLCTRYIVDNVDNPDISIIISKEEVDKEIAICESQGSKNDDQFIIDESRGIVLYINELNETFIENFLVYKRIAEAALSFDIILIHGAVIACGDSSYMFTAPSGTGKTTHIKKWLSNLNNAYVVNGDKPLIKVTEEGVFACGTPWCGKEGWETNAIVPLKGIILMERSNNNDIEKIPFSQAYLPLLKQTYMSKDPEIAKKVLKLLGKLSNKVDFFKFHFNNYKDDCFEVAYTCLCEPFE